MNKRLSQTEFQNLIRKLIIKEAKETKIIKEDEDDEDLGIYSDFDTNEFEGPAMQAAMRDIEDSGDKFVPLGKSKYEKNLDTTEFAKDLERQKLNLPSDKKTLGKIKGALDKRYKHEKQFGAGSLNEFEDEGPQPGDAEYHDEKLERFNGLSNFNDIDWQVIHEVLVNNTNALKYKKPIKDITFSVNNFEEIGASKEDLELLDNKDIIYIWDGMPIIDDEKYLNYNNFLHAAQLAWKKGFDTTQFNQDHNVETPYLRGREEQMDENILDKPKDAEGNDISTKMRVEDIVTGAIGRVIRFGIDDNGKQTVHIDWIAQFGAPIPKSITYPNKIVVKDAGRIFEDEIEEGMGHSYTIGKGQNTKPSNYPKELERQKMKEAYDYAGSEIEYHDKQNLTDDQEVYLVIDNDFNRAHYSDLIGQTFEDAPAYAQVKIVKKSEIPKLAAEDLDYTAKEETVNYANKKVSVKNMEDIHNLIDLNPKRIQSIFTDLHNELNNNNVINNKVVASDYMDTQWIFDIIKVDDNTVYLEFTGTAK